MLAIIFLSISLLSSHVGAVDVTRDPDLIARLDNAATQLDRQKLLSKDSDWTFDFFKQDSYTYSPGSVVNANAATFPALSSVDMTLAYLNLGPCAMLPPHYHPRATNLVVAIEGTTDTYMVEENGARLVKETLTPGEMTIFPKASLHSMQNTGCGNATLISALNSADTGTQNYVNSLFMLPTDLIKAGLGGEKASWVNLEKLSERIPKVGTGSILGSEKCIAVCKKKGLM